MPCNHDEHVLEGVFAVAKPASVSSADVLDKLQATFATSALFAPLLRTQQKRPSKSHDQVFKMGHGGTLDPLAEGVLIVGIGRGTKLLQQYLACSKTYETVVQFGSSTDTYDCTGTIVSQAGWQHVNAHLVQSKLEQFQGDISQAPPVYSALKVNGIKACEYVRQGKELPRQLESREMHVDECTLLEWLDGGQHDNHASSAPAARILLTVSSGFYVRSFAHDLGIACQSLSHMSALRRIRQANFTVESADSAHLLPAVTYSDLEAGEHVWGPLLKPQLVAWVEAHPILNGHVNGRDTDNKRKMTQQKLDRPRQRFRGGWVADDKHERIKQQGGKYKGKWSRRPKESEQGSQLLASPNCVEPPVAHP